jgi:hypothetical protein
MLPLAALHAMIGESTGQILSLALPLNPTRAYLLAIPTIRCELTTAQLVVFTVSD